MNDIEARLWEPTPWHATQRAVWEALRKGEEGKRWHASHVT
jgi:hypothetical protein